MNSGFVSIIGRPNVGKSTFLNNFLGKKISAVSPRPQTTRNRITGVYSSGEGQIIFLDTPGIHKPLNKMHKRMVQIALAQTSGIDVILLMIDASKDFGRGDKFIIDHLRDVEIPVALALNKIDLIKKTKLLPLIDMYQQSLPLRATIPISALKKDGFENLRVELMKILPEADPLYPVDIISDQPDRVFAAEIIREKLFLNMRQEIPFCSAVLIDAFEENEKLLDIAATILVEKPTQKGMVIGKGGQMIRTIGTQARKELENIFGTRIFMELFVKVKDQWRDNESILKDLGIE